MACTSYSSNTNAQIALASSTLPGGFCPAGYQALFDAIATYITGNLPGNYSTFLIKDSTPDATDRDKLWVSVDTNCKPLGFFLYNTTHSAWLPVGQRVYDCGTAGGTANALTATADPTLKYLSDGQLFIVKAASANTGAATLNVSGIGVYGVKKQGNQALAGGEILPNMILLLNVRDISGTPYYELLNPAPGAAAIAPQFRVINGSFETDSDGDGQPDGWTFTAIGAGTGATDSTAGHGAKSYKVVVSASGGGTLAYNEKIPFCGDTTSGEVLVLSFWHRVSNNNTTDIVTIEWYNAAGTSVSGPTTLWSGGTSRPNNTWIRVFVAITLPDTTARFFKVRLVGGSTGAATGDTYFDGVMVETVVFKRRVEYQYTGSASTASYVFVPPSGVTMVRSTVVGAGGGGATGNALNVTSGGGGGGGGVAVALTPVTPGTSYAVVVGAGGAASTAGSNSSFNSVVGNGGSGAAASPATTGGAGGGGTVGAPNYGWIFTGGDGTAGGAGTLAGNGGCSYGGGGAAIDSAAGFAGSPYGGGGAGGSRVGSAAAGTGAHGFVLIEF